MLYPRDCTSVKGLGLPWMNVLAIDQGTSSTKALVVSPGGGVLAEANSPVHPRAGAQGAVEQDPTELLQSIIEAGHAALAAADV